MNILNLITNPINAIIFLLGIVAAITVHEFAHAWTADRLGDDTPHLMGRVTLNPLAHLDPIGSIMFLLVGFGWGKPVIYNPMRLSRRVDELLIALAGPFSNILFAIVLNLLAVSLPHFLPNANVQPILIASTLNIYLAAFNILPIPPLDGSSIVAYFWPEYRSLVGGQIGFIILISLILLSSFGGGNLLSAIITPFINAFAHASTLFGLIHLWPLVSF